jgi:ABC-type uncharacterized transport system ATPase subunit
VLQGNLRFLIGPNGAGKTTLVDAILSELRDRQAGVLAHGQKQW